MWKLIVVLVLACAAPVFGQDQPETRPDDDFLADLVPSSWSLTSALRSKYVFSNGFLMYDRPVIQTDLFGIAKSGLTFDLWTSVPTDFAEIGDNYGTEVCLTLGWCGKVGDYNVSASVAYEDLYRVLSPEGSDFITISGEVSRKFEVTPALSVSPFVRVETNFTPDGNTQGDTLPRFGARYAWTINDMLSLGGKAMVVYDPGIAGGDAAWVGNIESALSWKVGRATIELPFARLVSPLTSVSDGRHSHLIIGAGISFSF